MPLFVVVCSHQFYSPHYRCRGDQIPYNYIAETTGDVDSYAINSLPYTLSSPAPHPLGAIVPLRQTERDLSDNSLTTLPAGVFAALKALFQL